MLYLEGAGYSTARVTGDGSFEFRGVLPGTYTLFPSGSLFPSPPQRIEVSDQDLADIAVPTPLRLEVQGKIVSRAGAPVTGDLAMSICSNVLEAAGPRRPPRCESVKAHSVDGGFSVLLPEGSYKFRVGRFNAAANRATSAGEVRSITYGGADVLNQPITVNRAAPAELLITLASTSPPEGAIPGQMYVDGQVPSGFSVQSIKILLIPQAGGSQLEADVNADGSFAFENTDPNARYKVGIKGPAAVYLIAARYGGVNPLSTPIEIKSAGTPLQIQIGFQPGRVEVAIKDGATFVAGAQVRLQPEASYRDDLVRNGTADSQGRVLFAGVPPGNYFIVVEQPKSPNPLGQPGTVGTLIRVERASAAAITIQIHP
jgi:hypothetical protein